MRIVKLIIAVIFIASIAISIPFNRLLVDTNSFLLALGLYLFFSLLFFNLRTYKKGKLNLNHGTSYDMSFVLFTGPLGLLIYEVIHRVALYIYKKRTKTASPEEFTHLFYNIGAFVLANSLAYYLFAFLFPAIENEPVMYWLLLFVLVFGSLLLTDTFLVIIYFAEGDFKTRKDIIQFYNRRSLLDTGRGTLTNGLLFIFLTQGKWEVIVSFFILNYLVSRSLIVKSQSLQDRAERDKFEQMAYTDFLTGVPNRAFMDKTMKNLQDSGEYIGVIVADIDHFKSINDTYNHAVGDLVIQHFALFIRNNIGEDDYIFRSGGEEFTVFIRNRKYDDTVQLVEKLREGVERSIVDATFKNMPVLIRFTASFGLYYYKINRNLTLEKAHIYADNLLLDAKKIGRNRVTVKNGMIDVPLSSRYDA